MVSEESINSSQAARDIDRFNILKDLKRDAFSKGNQLRDEYKLADTILKVESKPSDEPTDLSAKNKYKLDRSKLIIEKFIKSMKVSKDSRMLLKRAETTKNMDAVGKHNEAENETKRRVG